MTAEEQRLCDALEPLLGRAGCDYVAGADEAETRLTHALEAAQLIAAAYDAETVQGWFLGQCQALDDQAPAQALRDGDPNDLRSVVAAARGWLAVAAL